jgi:hypothetical protein
MVVDLKLGRRVLELATLVCPVFAPTLRLSAVLKLPGFFEVRYKGCEAIDLLPPSIDPIIYPIIMGIKIEPPPALL